MTQCTRAAASRPTLQWYEGGLRFQAQRINWMEIMVRSPSAAEKTTFFRCGSKQWFAGLQALTQDRARSAWMLYGRSCWLALSTPPPHTHSQTHTHTRVQAHPPPNESRYSDPLAMMLVVLRVTAADHGARGSCNQPQTHSRSKSSDIQPASTCTAILQLRGQP